MAKIKDYIPIIKSKILPAMQTRYNIKFYTEPVLLRPISVTYTGSDSNTRVMLEFNSDYKSSGKDLLQPNELFATVFYGFARS